MIKTTILLADDHTVVRQGLRALIEAEEDLQVIGEASNGREAVTEAVRLKPDLILLDIAMPQLNGRHAACRIRRAVPRAKILALSSFSDGETVRQMLRAGVAGYLVKQTAADDLLRAIREVRRGVPFFSPEIARGLRQQNCDAAGNLRTGAKSPELSRRQMEVLQLIAEGFSNKRISPELGISVKTVEKHRQEVMNKLNIHEAAGLTRYAVSKGMVGADRHEVEMSGARPVQNGSHAKTRG